MARTKAEIRAFLDGQVGKRPYHPKPYEDLTGQCVTLIKVLLDFLGAPNPYAARGNAISVNDTLLRQGIAQPNHGWLTIVVNRDMGYIGGQHYGHIWIDLWGEANYESNGRQALTTTKNTRPYTQGQQFVNLDNYVIEEEQEVKIGSGDNWRWRFNRLHHQLVRNADMPEEVFQAIIGKDAWGVAESWSSHPESDQLIKWQEIGETADRDKWTQQIYTLQDERNIANAKVLEAQQQLANAIKPEELAAAKQAVADAQATAKQAQDALSVKLEEDAAADKVGQGFIRWIISKITGGK